jgi:DUF4097 and DUF4098 domain-containing protein YvlB
MQKVFDTPTPTSLYVEIGGGDVDVRAEVTDRTTVDVTGKHADDVSVEQRGEQILVIAPPRRSGFFGGGDDLYVRIVTPLQSRLATKLGSADVVATGVLGEARLRSGSGDARLETVEGDAGHESGSGDLSIGLVTGDLASKSGSGDVDAEEIGGSATVSTGSGDVEVGNVGGDVLVKTGSGDVELGSSHGAVQVKTGSGSLRIRQAMGNVALSTASGDLLVDLMGAGQLQANNVSGDVRLGIPAGLPVWTDVSTVTGSVSSSLDGAGQPGEGQEYLELRARTVSGDIHLEQR